MSSETFSSRPPFDRPSHSDSTDRSHRSRVGSPHLAAQQIEAANREMRERLSELESRPRDRKAAGDAIRLAWSILMLHGLNDFDDIRSLRTEDWPSAIDTTQHALVAVALEVIGWYQFGLRPYDIDRTARIFDRCLELSPHNQRALERFAIVANTILPEHISGLAKFPKKQRETALGYKLQCKRKIDNILFDVFGISEAHLLGQANQTITELLEKRSSLANKTSERRFIFEILGHLSRINTVVGDFFGNGTQLSLGTGAACCQLELLGLPRDISNLLTLLNSRLESGESAEAVGEETALVCEILGVIAGMFESKWRIFKNHGAQRRAQEIREFVERLGQRGI
jgi:hypothetical protein